MATGFDIRHFFIRAPRSWLERYFAAANLLLDFDWKGLPKRKIDALLGRWSELDDTTRQLAVDDFRNIRRLATPACKMQIIDEAAHFDRESEVAAKLLELGDFYACAFWLLLDEPELWNGALRYAQADGKSKTYWRKRINMPKFGKKPTKAERYRLSTALSHYFTSHQSRGVNCVVHSYTRGSDARREYYFAYPEDHRHTPLIYEEGELVAQPHNPVFDVIFVHDDEAQTLNIWHDGNKEQIKDLQVIFAEAVLGRFISRNSPKDDRAYDLQGFLAPEFSFAPDPMLGIEDVQVRKLRVHVGGEKGRKMLVTLDKGTSSSVIHDDLAAAFKGVHQSQLQVTLVGLEVTFNQLPNENYKRTRTFQIATPNSCNLKIDDFSPLIERLLVDHGIEPKSPTENAGQ